MLALNLLGPPGPEVDQKAALAKPVASAPVQRPGFGGPLQFLDRAIEKPVDPRMRWPDQVLRGLSSGLIAADWLTTVDGLRKGLPESNPILGRHPSLGKANALIGAGLFANAFLVPKIRNPQLRRAIWLGMTLLELDALRANRSAGLGFNFRF